MEGHFISQGKFILGMVNDIRCYNFLIASYNEIEHLFNVPEFLGQLEADGLTPTQVTFQCLIQR